MKLTSNHKSHRRCGLRRIIIDFLLSRFQLMGATTHDRTLLIRPSLELTFAGLDEWLGQH